MEEIPICSIGDSFSFFLASPTLGVAGGPSNEPTRRPGVSHGVVTRMGAKGDVRGGGRDLPTPPKESLTTGRDRGQWCHWASF